MMNGPEMIEFAEAIRKAFLFNEVETLLKRLKLDITDYIVAHTTYPEQVKAIVARANAGNWIDSFVSAAVRDRPADRAIRSFLVKNPHWDPSRYPLPPHPCDTLFVLGGKAFIGRSVYREYLKRMNAPTGRKVLLITSDRRKVGKSYSKELIDFLVDGQQLASVIPIDLDEQDYDPGSLAKKIGAPMKIMGDPPEQMGQQPARWSPELLDWLIPKVPSDGIHTVWWIVLDGFRQKMPSEATQEFISQLAQRVQETSRFRLLLVNYAYRLPLKVEAFTYKDRVLPLADTDIATFLEQVHEQRRGAKPEKPQLIEYVDAYEARLAQYRTEHPEEADGQLLLHMAVVDTAELI
jgi:Effector-associated domain 1